MLVFKRGQWIEVELSFSDPALSFGQLQYAAAVVAEEMGRNGASQQAAVQTAEKRMYERVYPGLRYTAPPLENK
jgi:hypothetical protein